MKTKNFIILLIFSIVLTCCKSAKELAMEGKYDKAFNKALDNLKKQPTNIESIEILKLSFENANKLEMEQINQLNFKNSPDRWEKISNLYNSLQNRQSKMKQIYSFLPLSAQSSIRTYDYGYELENARKNAANYHYSQGIFLLDSNNKTNARYAIDHFNKVKNYDSGYPEINQLIDEAYFTGTNHVLFLVNNYTANNLPRDFMMSISSVGNNSFLNSTWVKYYTNSANNFNYDYVIELNLNNLRQVPERINSKSSVYTKTIDDGWEYEYDRRGNVKKDTQGNDIKRNKTKTIRCEVIVSTQTKSMFLDAKMNYIYSQTNRIIRSIPIGIEQPFFHEYVTFRGDKTAIDRQILLKLPKSERPALFPTTTDMIFMAQNRFADLVYAALRDNNHIIKN